MDLGLKDKIAVVTGASQGLGYATAEVLAQEGAKVVINSRNITRLESAAQRIAQKCGQPVITIAGDVTEPSFPEALIARTVQELGGIDILITNAGGPPPGKFEDFDDAAWQRGVELSFLSHVRLIRAALPFLRQSSAAAVLTITSISVKQPLANLILSNSIRAATVGLTKSLSIECGGEGIRFNSILPSWTETERVYELLSNRAAQRGTTVEQESAINAGETPLGRIGKPEEFARAAAFLVSPAASYINGVMLAVDGGSYKGLL